MITSTDNARVKALIQLNTKARARRESGTFIAEGIRMVQETPKELLECIYVSESMEDEVRSKGLLDGVSFEVLSDKVFAHVSDTKTPQGILCVAKQKQYSLEDLLPKDKPAMLLVLESIQDPGNLGTMFRTGEGAGATGILMNRTTVDLYNPKTIRSTMGSLYRMPYLIVDDLPATLTELKVNANVNLCAAHLQGAVDYDEPDYTRPTAFLIGNEGNGLSDELADLANTRIKIPMEGSVESLNAAIAATVLMYEGKRQRKKL